MYPTSFLSFLSRSDHHQGHESYQRFFATCSRPLIKMQGFLLLLGKNDLNNAVTVSAGLETKTMHQVTICMIFCGSPCRSTVYEQSGRQRQVRRALRLSIVDFRRKEKIQTWQLGESTKHTIGRGKGTRKGKEMWFCKQIIPVWKACYIAIDNLIIIFSLTR